MKILQKIITVIMIVNLIGLFHPINHVRAAKKSSSSSSSSSITLQGMENDADAFIRAGKKGNKMDSSGVINGITSNFVGLRADFNSNWSWNYGDFSIVYGN